MNEATGGLREKQNDERRKSGSMRQRKRKARRDVPCYEAKMREIEGEAGREKTTDPST